MPFTVLNKTVPAKRGSLEGGSWDAFLPIAPKAIFPDPHIILFKPITVLNKTVSSKRGFLEEGSWDVFLTYRSKSNLFRTLM